MARSLPQKVQLVQETVLVLGELLELYWVSPFGNCDTPVDNICYFLHAFLSLVIWQVLLDLFGNRPHQHIYFIIFVFG